MSVSLPEPPIWLQQYQRIVIERRYGMFCHRGNLYQLTATLRDGGIINYTFVSFDEIEQYLQNARPIP